MSNCEALCDVTKVIIPATESTPLDEVLNKVESGLARVKATWNGVEDRKKKYEDEIEELKESNHKIARRLQDAINIKDQVVYWQRKFKDCERKMKKMEDEVSLKREELKNKDNELDLLREENAMLQAKTKKKGNKKELKLAKEEARELREENTTLTTQVFDKAKMIRFLYDKVNTVDAINHEYKKTCEENKRLMNENTSLEKKVEKLKIQLRKVSKNLKHVNEENHSKETNIESIEELKVNIKDLMLKNDEKDLQLEKFQERIQDLELINTKLNDELQNQANKDDIKISPSPKKRGQKKISKKQDEEKCVSDKPVFTPSEKINAIKKRLRKAIDDYKIQNCDRDIDVVSNMWQ